MNPGIGQPHPLRREISASLSRYFVAGERAGDLVLLSPVGFEFDGRVEWISGMLERRDVHDEDYRMFRTLTEADGVFLDIGANYGYSAVSVWATGATCAVISFEPILAFEPCLEVIARLRPGRYDYRIMVNRRHRGARPRRYHLGNAVQAGAPRAPSTKMPQDNAERVIEGARHMSPALGDRMLPGHFLGRAVFIRELRPQDLKVEIDRLSREEAMKVAKFLAAVVGRAHGRQLDRPTRRIWQGDLSRNRQKDLDAPSWLWSSIVELVSSHEAAYLEHCRRYAMNAH